VVFGNLKRQYRTELYNQLAPGFKPPSFLEFLQYHFKARQVCFTAHICSSAFRKAYLLPPRLDLALAELKSEGDEPEKALENEAKKEKEKEKDPRVLQARVLAAHRQKDSRELAKVAEEMAELMAGQAAEIVCQKCILINFRTN
jgi:hypothetical protein